MKNIRCKSKEVQKNFTEKCKWNLKVPERKFLRNRNEILTKIWDTTEQIWWRFSENLNVIEKNVR